MGLTVFLLGVAAGALRVSKPASASAAPSLQRLPLTMDAIAAAT
jgi:hypothetical protein